MKHPPITSKLEKLVAGLVILRDHQASAKLVVRDGSLIVGDTSDPYLSQGMKDHLEGLGFVIVDNRFVFKVNE